MTETEAKEKWCPMIREGSRTLINPAMGPRVEGDVRPPHFASCIGSACMMWRWGMASGEQIYKACKTYDGQEENRHGHCGLAL
jgi:hypothetical protein